MPPDFVTLLSSNSQHLQQQPPLLNSLPSVKPEHKDRRLRSHLGQQNQEGDLREFLFGLVAGGAGAGSGSASERRSCSMTTSNLTSASGEASVSSGNRGDSGTMQQQAASSNTAATTTTTAAGGGIGPTSAAAAATASGNAAVPGQPPAKKKRNLPGTPDPDAEVIALSPKTLMATNRFVCEICGKGFQRDQNLQLHRRGHNLPWKLRQRTSKEPRKRVYVCPEASCVHHDPSRALGDLTGIKKHFCRKHGEKKWKCDKCNKRYAVQSDWKAHSKTCGTREYRCDCGTLFSRRDSFITHRAFCDALAEESGRIKSAPAGSQQLGIQPGDASGASAASLSEGGAATAAASAMPASPYTVRLDPSPNFDDFSLLGAPRSWGGAAGAGAGGGSSSAATGPLRLSLFPGGGPGPPAPPQISIQQLQSGEELSHLDHQSSFLMPPKNMQSLLGQFDMPGDRSSFGLYGGIGAAGGGAGGSSFSDLMGMASGRLDHHHLAGGGAVSSSSAGLAAGNSTSVAASSNGGSGFNAGFMQQQQQQIQSATPQMSATALLQKAAQMGATAGNNSLLRGFGLDTSSFGLGSFWQSQQQQQIGRSNSNNNSSGQNLRREGSIQQHQEQQPHQFGGNGGEFGASSGNSYGAMFSSFPPSMFGDVAAAMGNLNPASQQHQQQDQNPEFARPPLIQHQDGAADCLRSGNQASSMLAIPKIEEGDEHGLTRDFLGVSGAIASLMSNQDGGDDEENLESLGAAVAAAAAASADHLSEKSWDGS